MPGRKSKATITSISENIIQEKNEINPLNSDVMPMVELKPKRERKKTKHAVVAIVTENGIQGNFSQELSRPMIAHLPIHSSEISFQDPLVTYDPNPPMNPEGFDVGETDPFSMEASYENQGPVNISIVPETNEEVVLKKEVVVEKEEKVVEKSVARKNYGPSQLLVCYQSTKTTQVLPSSVDVACFWCCEQFSNQPCIIPKEKSGNVWSVYGNFCTPQCAMAYLLSELLDNHVRWERISYINHIYGNNYNGRIYPAPSRETLQRFGGPIRAEDFHDMCDKQNVRVDIHMPPMVSILSSMDTKPIDFYETNIHNSFANPVSYPSYKAESGELKLKRSKPLKEHANTLDSVLNIQTKPRSTNV